MSNAGILRTAQKQYTKRLFETSRIIIIELGDFAFLFIKIGD